MNVRWLVLVLGMFLVGSVNGQWRGGTGDRFTYQGELLVSGNPANGPHDFRFTLYDNGIFIDELFFFSVAVTDGVFTLDLEFNAFFRDLEQPELEVAVFDPGLVDYVTIAGPQALLPNPVSHLARSVVDGAITSESIVNGSVRAQDVDANEVQRRVNGICAPDTAIRTIASDGTVECEPVGAATAAWLLDGNAGTTAGTDFVGTTDNQPLDLRTNDQRALRLEWGFSSSGAPNLIGGSQANAIPATSEASVIAGGGLLGAPNSVQGNGSSVGGGIDNQINGSWSTIPGGRANRVNGNDSVALGRSAQANHDNTFVWSSGGTFASTADDQFLIDADRVGIGVNNPSDLLHLNAPVGVDALRVQTNGTTRLRVHDNGGVSIGANATPPAAGLAVQGDIRFVDARTRWVTINPSAFVPQTPDIAYDRASTRLWIDDNLQNFHRVFFAPVQLPHGATITEMKVSVFDNNPNDSMEIELVRDDWRTTGNDEHMATVNSGGGSSATRILTDSSIAFEVVDNENYSYALRLSAAPFRLFVLNGVRIRYLSSQLQP